MTAPHHLTPVTQDEVEAFMDGAYEGSPAGSYEVLGGVGRVVVEVARHVQRSRLPVPEVDVVPLGAPVAPDPVADAVAVFDTDDTDDFDEVLGGGVRGNDFPLAADLVRQLGANSPNGNGVRLDTEDSYRAFRADGARQTLEDRVDDIEAAFAEHVSDGHGGQAYRPVLLSLPPYARGKVACWQHGDRVLCTLAVEDPEVDGPRFVTAATPLARHVDEVLDCARVSPDDVVGCLEHVSGVLAGGSLVPQLARATPTLLSRPEAKTGHVFVGRMSSRQTPGAVAALQLLQMAQSGDPQAADEWRRLAAVAEASLRDGFGAALQAGLRERALALGESIRVGLNEVLRSAKARLEAAQRGDEVVGLTRRQAAQAGAIIKKHAWQTETTASPAQVIVNPVGGRSTVFNAPRQVTVRGGKTWHFPAAWHNHDSPASVVVVDAGGRAHKFSGDVQCVQVDGGQVS